MDTQRTTRPAHVSAVTATAPTGQPVPPSSHASSRRLGFEHGDVGVALLAQSGVKPTWTRLAILEVLHEQQRAQSVTEILQYLLACGIALNVGTVYVTLRALSAAGVVVAHTDVGRRTLYALPGDEDVVSVTCSRCGGVQVLDAPATRQVVEQLCEAHGYLPRQMRLNISAICAACRRD